MTDEIEIIVEEENTLGETNSQLKIWQWVYLVENSPIWNITTTYLSKEQFLLFAESFNNTTTYNKIVDYRKVKITKHYRDIKSNLSNIGC